MIDDPPPVRIDDGVIHEAQRHAKRRRIGYLVWACGTALLLAAGTFMAMAGPTAESGLLNDDGGVFAPAAGRDADVVAAWSRIHAGWVFVYADGRVLIHPDTASGITEMQLSTAGIEAVRSGEVPADSFVVAPWTIPTSAWASSVARDYSTDLSAVCPDAAATQAGTLPALQDRLPTAVRRILAGTITTFAADPYGIGMAPNLDGAVECWILTRSQSIAVWEQSRGFEGLGGPDGEFVSGRHDQGQWGTLIDPDGSWIGFNVEPVLPHGGFVFWGG